MSLVSYPPTAGFPMTQSSDRLFKNLSEYAGLLGRACPAAVYEYADADAGSEDAAGKKFVINSQNCIHVSRFRYVSADAGHDANATR